MANELYSFSYLDQKEIIKTYRDRMYIHDICGNVNRNSFEVSVFLNVDIFLSVVSEDYVDLTAWVSEITGEILN